MPSLTLHLVDLAVDVRAEAPLLEALGSLWRGTLTPVTPPVERRALEVRSGVGLELWSGDERVARTDDPQAVLPLLEEELAALVQLSSEARGRAVLHAAGFVLDGRPHVVVGDSGAGKSTLALAAVRRGARLLSDEWLVTDGALLWGVPRAVQFEPLPEGAPLPPWLDGVTVLRDGLRGRDGARLSLPHLPVERVSGPVPASAVEVVVLARGPLTAVEPLEPVAALTAVLEAQRGRQSVAWERLLSRPRRLVWRDGPSGLQALTGS